MAFLVFGATCEIQLDRYLNTKMLAYYDPVLANKLKNLQPDLERQSKKIFDFLEKSNSIEVIQQYHTLVSIFEIFTQKAESMEKLTEFLNIAQAWQRGEIKIVDS